MIPTHTPSPGPRRSPFDIDPEYVIYEYGCNEGNYGLANTLSGARVSEEG